MADIAPFDSSGRSFTPIPARAGIGLRACHHEALLERHPAIGWIEVHPENYMGAGGPAHRDLERACALWPLSLHGVGLSLGSAGPLDEAHLDRLAGLVRRYQPGLISEHLAWTTSGGRHFNDLLPVPLTRESLEVVSHHVDQAQTALKRRILVENPSTYLCPAGQEMTEPEFLVELARRTGCGILLDVNNVFVSACNHDFDAAAYIEEIPWHLVGEVHLAGHAVKRLDGREVRIDDHGSRVSAEVWSLYEALVRRIGAAPTLVEWDTNVPALEVLLEEAASADRVMERAFGLGPVLGSRHARPG